MQFNDHANNRDIISDITFFTGATITDYTLNDRTRNCNLALDRVIAMILGADQRWEWDDTNNSDLPIATTNIVSGQRDYGISGATYLKITKVICKDANGTWRILRPIDKNSPEAANMNKQQSPGNPQYYDLIGNSIFLEPIPNYAATAGLRVFTQRNVSYFTIASTTKKPGFAQPFHRLISLYASEDYLVKRGMHDQLRGIRGQIAGLEVALVKFYKSRNPEDQARLRFRKENYGQRNLKRMGRDRANDGRINW